MIEEKEKIRRRLVDFYKEIFLPPGEVCAIDSVILDKNIAKDPKFLAFDVGSIIGSSVASRTSVFVLIYDNKLYCLSGWWRNNLLTVARGNGFAYNWSNEDGEEIPRPYPDGDRFELLARKIENFLSS